jgi:hypothetical protein
MLKESIRLEGNFRGRSMSLRSYADTLILNWIEFQQESRFGLAIYLAAVV